MSSLAKCVASRWPDFLTIPDMVGYSTRICRTNRAKIYSRVTFMKAQKNAWIKTANNLMSVFP